MLVRYTMTIVAQNHTSKYYDPPIFRLWHYKMVLFISFFHGSVRIKTGHSLAFYIELVLGILIHRSDKM